MDDQANGLRRLMGQDILPWESSPDCGPRRILVTSGKGGTGTTTLALGLAAATAQRGREVVLIDAAAHGGDIASLCRIDERWTIADVFNCRATAGEAIQPGPGRVRVLPGAWGQENLDDSPAAGYLRLKQQLSSLAAPVDDVVVDGGSGSGRTLRRFWQSAHLIVVVTTPEMNSVMDTYASIKLLSRGHRPARISAIVNRAPGAAVAASVHQRLARSCKRFLAIELEYAGYVSEHSRWFGRPEDDALAITAGQTGRQIRGIVEGLAAGADVPQRLTA